MDASAIKETIARGVINGFVAYLGKTAGGDYEPFLFREALDPEDVEISEDAFIITSEEAEKLIKPPTLTSLRISPAQAQMKPGERQAFRVKGLDQHDQEIELEAVAWKATGGEVDSDGVFAAGEDGGHFIITVSAEGITDSATVVIAAEETAPTGTGPDPLPPEPTSPPPPPGEISWAGDIPHQKWMNFYMKVLAKFVNEPDFNISVNFHVKPGGEVNEQKMEEIRQALRELGLGDDVRMG